MNLEHDIQEAGVQMILLVEDSIRFYSSILPNLYNYILEQSKNFSKEALNRHAATMRMRGRPKVVLARTYEEALKLYRKYSDNTLGVISDARFPLQNAAKAFCNRFGNVESEGLNDDLAQELREALQETVLENDKAGCAFSVISAVMTHLYH